MRNTLPNKVYIYLHLSYVGLSQFFNLSIYTFLLILYGYLAGYYELVDIKQGRDEPLKEFVERFNEAILDTEERYYQIDIH